MPCIFQNFPPTNWIYDQSAANFTQTLVAMLVTFCKTGGGVGNTDFLKYMITFVTSPLNKQTVIKPGTKPSLKFGGLPQFLFFPTILLVGLLVIIVWEFLYHIKGNVPHFFYFYY